MPRPRMPEAMCTRSSPGLARLLETVSEWSRLHSFCLFHRDHLWIAVYCFRDLGITIFRAGCTGGNLLTLRRLFRDRPENDGDGVVINCAPMAGLLDGARQRAFGGQQNGVHFILVERLL